MPRPSGIIHSAMPIIETVTRYDVERAVRRAQLFRQGGFTTTPTVAGSEISQEVQLAAQQAGCAVVLGGRYEFDLPFRG